MALKLDGNQLVVAFAERPSRETVDAISGLVGYRVVPMLADPTVIARVVSSWSASGRGGASQGREP